MPRAFFVFYRHLQCYASPFALLSQFVRIVVAICSQCYGKPQAAVGDRFIVPAYTYSPRIRNPFRIHSRNVRNVFILCMLYIRYAKVWFLRHKSMVFGVQKPPFYIAKTPFLKCNILNKGTEQRSVVLYVRCTAIAFWC